MRLRVFTLDIVQIVIVFSNIDGFYRLLLLVEWVYRWA